MLLSISCKDIIHNHGLSQQNMLTNSSGLGTAFTIREISSFSKRNAQNLFLIDTSTIRSLFKQNMPPPKKKQTSSLGRAVIKSRFQGQKAIALDEGKLVSFAK